MAATIALTNSSPLTQTSRLSGLCFEPGPVPSEQIRVDFPGPQTSAAAVADRPHRLDPATYRRRRWVLGVALVVVGAIIWTIATWAVNSSIGVNPVGADRNPAAMEVYVVQPGDTLWSIAAGLDGDGDVRDTVDRLAELNGGSALSAGQRLVVGR